MLLIPENSLLDEMYQYFLDMGIDALQKEVINWIKIIRNIEVDLINSSKVEQEFLKIFIAWIKQALQHTSVIVVEGNL